MPVFLHYNDLTVEVFDDDSFDKTKDSPTAYNKIIQAEQDKEYSPNSRHAIAVHQEGKVINTAIILASGGGTGVHKDTALIDEGNLIIRCCNKLFSLSLPDLNINWVAEPDWATCFSVHQYNDSYITHGETSIARIDRKGNIMWSYGGADIFVCLYEGTPFEMHGDYIGLTDFDGNKYRINFSGETISYEPSALAKQRTVIILKQKRKWWKFW